MKRILVALAVFPLAAFAQAQQAPARPGGGPGPGPGPNATPAQRAEHVERHEKRAEMALVLGLSEALDLDTNQALKLRDTLAKYQERRLAAHKQLADARDAIRDAARGEKASAQQVDDAVKKALDARAQIEAIQREAFAAVSKDLTPEKKARAFLFLGRFADRFGPGEGMGHGMRGGKMGRGMGPGAGMGPGGGMGPGMMQGGMMGMGPGPDCPCDDDE
jgi:hypothetical protein